MSHEALRQLPAVNTVLEQFELGASRDRFCREALVGAIRAAIEEARQALLHDQPAAVSVAQLAHRAESILLVRRPLLRPVINATGILLHTGLGRAPLADEAIEAIAAIGRGYCNLEFRLEEGERGQRNSRVAAALSELTGAAAATVVNNNAGATVLALRALATGREVIVSRGQLVEIGGSFRLPEIFEVSGARLREVGTTNKTRLGDYASAIRPETAAILKVHHSNYQIVGFTEDPPLEGLVELAHNHSLIVIDDIGSGALAPGLPPNVLDEPHAAASIAKGADLVLFSGDKLLGGPQCGIMIGGRDSIRKIEADPLMRALRVDKLTLAALEATLELVRSPSRHVPRIPLWKMLSLTLPQLKDRAESLAKSLREEPGLNVTVDISESFIGGGSAPVQPLPTAVISLSPPYPGPFGSAAAWSKALRSGDPPVVSRIARGAVLFDLRTVLESEEPGLLDAIRKTCHSQEP